ncbi:MAG: hypothetical protein J5836_01720, partial [Clostridia bacterium]|nr:hypothetical protein [Clostridia bacterium]
MSEERSEGLKGTKLIDISKKTFISVLILLFALVVGSIVLTYILPKGEFATVDGSVDYKSYSVIEGASGINIFKGIFSPFLNLLTKDGLTVIILSVFLLIISGAFQVMNDVYGIKTFVNLAINKFMGKRFLLLAIVSFAFMAFGAFLGLFEEMLTLLPIMAILAVSLGFDSFTGFLISVVACGFGFSAAITNPFTVITASTIIGVSPMVNVWYRIVIFIVTYALFLGFLYLYVKRLEKNPEKSMTYERDRGLREKIYSEVEIKNESRIRKAYTIFFIVLLTILIVCSSLDALRDYTVIALAAVFLFGGFICGLVSSGGDMKGVGKSFISGVLSALPSVIFVLLAAAVKYVLVEGRIFPTITNEINNLVSSKNPYLIALILYAIVLVLEFFISSSTAKAIFVMSILGTLTLGLTKESLVLIYTFADGFTNMLFPTSPVLLIGLSMIGVSYFKWLKKSWWLFAITAVMVLAFIALAIAIG